MKRGAGWRRRNKKYRIVAGGRGRVGGRRKWTTESSEGARRLGGAATRPGNKRGGNMCASEWVAPALGIVPRSAGRTHTAKKVKDITKIQVKNKENDCPGYG